MAESEMADVEQEVIAFLTEKRDTALEQAIVYEKQILKLGGEVSHRLTKRDTEPSKHIGRRKSKQMRHGTNPRRQKVTEIAATLEQPVSIDRFIKMLYTGSDDRTKKCWRNAVHNAVKAGVVVHTIDGRYSGVAQ